MGVPILRFTSIDRYSLAKLYTKLRDFDHEKNEHCGVLIGTVKDGIAYFAEIVQIKNISEHPMVAFEFDPEEYLRAIEKTDWYTEDATYTLLGMWHTHPNYPGYPSEIDWNAALKGQVVEGAYLIFTTRGNDLYNYYWDGHTFTVLRIAN